MKNSVVSAISNPTENFFGRHSILVVADILRIGCFFDICINISYSLLYHMNSSRRDWLRTKFLIFGEKFSIKFYVRGVFNAKMVKGEIFNNTNASHCRNLRLAFDTV